MSFSCSLHPANDTSSLQGTPDGLQLAAPGDAGWREDGIAGGNIQLTQDGDQLDVIYTDTSGTRSMKADGFDVFNLQQTGAGFATVLAIHSRTGGDPALLIQTG